MIRLPGIIKVTSMLALDFLTMYVLFNDLVVASAVTGIIALYVLFGGYIALFKEGAVRSDKLPSYERSRLDAAKKQITEDVKNVSSINISGVKFYLIDGDHDMQATAYGMHCVSVSRGTLDNTDPMTLNAVLSHEISHTVNLDAEFSRALFSGIMMICVGISILSFSFIAIMFLVFLVCGFFASWFGIIFFKGTTTVISCVFDLFQKGIVLLARAIIGCLNRSCEYRCDRYSAQLGYGLQLSHFLSYAAPESHRQLSFTDALYRSHPATPKRIARLEAYANTESGLVSK